MANTVEWPVRLTLVEEDGTTTARAVLTTATTTFTGHGTARCSPEDRDIPEIGDEIAAGRALRDLAGQLLRVADEELEGVGAAPPRRQTRVAYGWTDAMA
ncbi:MULTISPECIES: dsRBD fold-containing protein [unclassified Streptomyces]|uniref:DsRBD fold-containing protein n=1 Tax=Streptomyces sirii TaxID=3127701 RepID=A0ABZ2QJJ5_9ACTN